MRKLLAKRRKSRREEELLVEFTPEPLYLNDEQEAASPVILVATIPPDLQQCQCEWRDTTVETFGPKPMVRCDNPPTVIAFQKRRHSEQPTGAISLCDDHRLLIEHMYPGQCYYRAIAPEQKIGGVV